MENKTKVIVCEGADGYDGLNVYRLAGDGDPGDLSGLIDQYPYRDNDTDLDVLDRVKEDYNVIEYRAC